VLRGRAFFLETLLFEPVATAALGCIAQDGLPSLLSSLHIRDTERTHWIRERHGAYSADLRVLAVRRELIYTIFEGTSEIQRLVIARMISGLQIP
jgi:hypothetical protein